MRNLIIASTSTVHGSGYLEYILKDIEILFRNTSIFRHLQKGIDKKPQRRSSQEHSLDVQPTRRPHCL